MNGRILIIDDEPHNLNILRIFLNSLHYEIFTVEDGKEALSMVRDLMPDLILLDVMMPEITGFEICRQLMAEADFDIPIIFLSANAQKEDILHGLRLGAVDYLTKPFDLDVLERKVEIALHQKAQVKNLKKDNKQLAKLVYVDALTGLYNRAYLDMTIAMMREGKKQFHAAMMVDMDYFKDINDNLGHLVGDQVLREVASIIQAKISSEHDLAFRYGGDEFLVLLHKDSNAMEIADSIVKEVDCLKVSLAPSKSQEFSVSIGLANNFDPTCFEQMITQADSALLGAKNSGRHQIKIR
ncbi:diguanylate cyclase [Paenibacillus sp. GCM10023248]|uniref:GGDEF domain-containing response regulator n=1 Tax=Bacillales TaxID=1385 RepID=UPI002378FEE1|nr:MULTISPECIES: diguanylate cyclase [Bacillales]MDD9272154.1 diguanylate cyclase [Paenibacillus sp. MAHUQ-63]MDR6885323.1 diguanylate cyclase (GGDEF)-like protein [Bacillus sp. 3255]